MKRQSSHRYRHGVVQVHHRSLNKEVIATLQATTEKAARPDVDQLLVEARAMRKKFKGVVILEEIQAWKIEGRR